MPSDEAQTGADLPKHYLASAEHPVRYVEHSRDLRRARRPTTAMRLGQLAFASIYIAIAAPLAWSAVVNRHPAPLALPILMVVVYLLAFLRSRGNGTVVDDRGVHLAMGERTGAAFLPAADIVHTEVFDRWDADWARSVRMMRYVKADRAAPCLGAELHTPTGPQRAVIGTSDPDALRAAIDGARASGVRPWHQYEVSTVPRAEPGELDIDLRRDGSDLIAVARGPHLERELRIGPKYVTGYRITRDPAYLQELRGRRDDRLSRFRGGAVHRRNRTLKDMWRMTFIGARTSDGIVEVTMHFGDGLPFSAVISTDHPERVASAIDDHVRTALLEPEGEPRSGAGRADQTPPDQDPTYAR